MSDDVKPFLSVEAVNYALSLGCFDRHTAARLRATVEALERAENMLAVRWNELQAESARAERSEADLATCRGMLNRLVGGEEARDLMEASAMVERNAVRRAKKTEAERDALRSICEETEDTRDAFLERAERAEAERDAALIDLSDERAMRAHDNDALRAERDEARAKNAALREALGRVEDQLAHDQPAWEHDHEDSEPWDECRACTYDAMLRYVRHTRAALATDGGTWLREFAAKCVQAGVRLGLPESTGPRTLEEVVEEVCK